MKTRRFTDQQFMCFLRQAEAGMSAKDMCRTCGLSNVTVYSWQAKFGVMENSDAQRLRALENENGKLKRLLADAHLGMHALKRVWPTSIAPKIFINKGFMNSKPMLCIS